MNYVSLNVILECFWSVFGCSKLTTETLEQGVKYVQN